MQPGKNLGALSADEKGVAGVGALLTNSHCIKARSIAQELTDLGAAFEVFDVDESDTAQRAFGSLFNDGRVKAPALIIGSRAFRNPAVGSLKKLASRHGLIDRVMIHEEKSGRFVWPMLPSDAFASYVWHGETMRVGHIEVDPSLRGSGLGSELGKELLSELSRRDHRVRLTCPFLRKVALADDNWAAMFLS